MYLFRNRQISTKLITGFLIVAVIAVLIGGVGVLNIKNMEHASTELYEKNAMSLKYSGAGASQFQEVRFHTINLATLMPSDIATARLQLDKEVDKYEAILAQLDGLIDTGDGIAYLNDIHTYWSDYQKVMDAILRHVENGNSDLALIVIRQTLTPIGFNMVSAFQSLMDVVSENADLRAGNNSQLASLSIIIMAAAAAGGLAISVFLGLYIARLIGKPLKQMADAAEMLALGDVDVRLPAVTKDEIGKLTGAFIKLVDERRKQAENMQRLAAGDLTIEFHAGSERDALGNSLKTLVESFNSLIYSIMNSAERVASDSTRVSDSSQNLSMGATEQASSIQQLTASLNEIAEQTTLNAKNAQSANALADNTRQFAEDGTAQMKSMLLSMDSLQISSRSINKIIKVIDDIAFQTNILALNAAVEAARAGQFGKGFAVVAEEVRTLSSKSAQAAKETTALIADIIRKIDEGISTANNTDKALSKIVDKVTDTVSLVDAIAAASTEQAAAIAQVNQGIAQVSLMIQSTAATSEESASASETLVSQARQLEEAISAFIVKKAVPVLCESESFFETESILTRY